MYYIKNGEKESRQTVAFRAPALAKVSQHVFDSAVIRMAKALSVWIKNISCYHLPAHITGIKENVKVLFEHLRS